MENPKFLGYKRNSMLNSAERGIFFTYETFMSRKNGILDLTEPKKQQQFFTYLYLWAFKFHA